MIMLQVKIYPFSLVCSNIFDKLNLAVIYEIIVLSDFYHYIMATTVYLLKVEVIISEGKNEGSCLNQANPA